MNTKDVILYGGIVLAILVFLGSLGNIFYHHYEDREYHLEQLQILEKLIVPGQDWTAAQKMLEEKGYQIQPIHTEVKKGKDLFFRCCWPLRKSHHNKGVDMSDYQVKMHYATHAVICVDPENNIKSCKGNIR